MGGERRFHNYNGNGVWVIDYAALREAAGIKRRIKLGWKGWLLHSSTLYPPAIASKDQTDG